MRVARSSIRLWFCLAVAVIAAAVADPCLEFASNAGWFGAGAFTDHSSLDVLPALLAGCLCAAFYVVLRVRHRLLDAGKALETKLARLLPAVFAVQIAVLYVMETAEQRLVWGHVLGGTVWLGAPVLISLAVHAAACVVLTFVLARALRALAATTLRVIALIQALATLPAHGAALAPRPRDAVRFNGPGPVLGGIGERAPPLPAA